MPYDVVGKLETFDDDLKYIVHTAGIANLILTSDTEALRNVAPVADKERTKKYFGMLGKKQKEALFEMYKLDFELFGYRADEYM